jgi:hypothetical protein
VSATHRKRKQKSKVSALRLLNQGRVPGDLRLPPGNRLEALRADRREMDHDLMRRRRAIDRDLKTIRPRAA